MKRWILLFVCITLFASCKSSPTTNNTSNTSDTTVILDHALFEQNGTPSLNGWTFHPAGTDDTLDFEQSAPPGMGTWSYKLHTSDFPPVTNALVRNYTGLVSGIYSFTAWHRMKYILAAGTFPEGYISVTKLSGGISTVTTQITTDDTAWHTVSLLDTFALQPSDTVQLLLSAGARTTGQHGNPLWFDDITFERLP